MVAPAAAATRVGETFDPGVSGGSGVTDLQSGSPAGQYAVPFAGVITSWSFQASAATVPTLKFKVGRSAGGNDFVIVGEDGPRTPTASMLSPFFTRIPVQAGDVIGNYRVAGGLFARSAGSDYSVQTVTADPAPGPTATTFSAPGSGFQLDLSATLELDADHDGFGDETQDKCASQAKTQAACDNNFTLSTKALKKGKAEITTTVPGAGTLVAGDSSDASVKAAAAKKKKPLLKRSTATAAAAGPVTLRSSPQARLRSASRARARRRPRSRSSTRPAADRRPRRPCESS